MNAENFINKYKLDQNEIFSHKHFAVDFRKEFHSFIQIRSVDDEITPEEFSQAVNQFRGLWEAINLGSTKPLPEKLWKYLYATIVIPEKKRLLGNGKN